VQIIVKIVVKSIVNFIVQIIVQIIVEKIGKVKVQNSLYYIAKGPFFFSRFPLLFCVSYRGSFPQYFLQGITHQFHNVFHKGLGINF